MHLFLVSKNIQESDVLTFSKIIWMYFHIISKSIFFNLKNAIKGPQDKI